MRLTHAKVRFGTLRRGRSRLKDLGAAAEGLCEVGLAAELDVTGCAVEEAWNANFLDLRQVVGAEPALVIAQLGRLV